MKAVVAAIFYTGSLAACSADLGRGSRPADRLAGDSVRSVMHGPYAARVP